MLNPVDFSGRPFHFIGIGGIGMSALAYILAQRKLPVSGSDLCLNHITRRLQQEGAHIFWQQDAANLHYFNGQAHQTEPSSRDSGPSLPAAAPSDNGQGTAKEVASKKVASIDASVPLPQVICSTAINATNSEYRAAIELGCPIFHRSDLLAALIQDYRSIAVAGTHGKTTTSSLIGYLMLWAGLDPTIVIGGEVAAWEGNARMGHGDYLVAEADESDGTLKKLSAYVGVVTNIELDHPDHYNSLQDVVEVFQSFASQCHTVVGCIDCETVRETLRPAISYSLHRESGADYTVDDVVYGAEGTIAQVWERGEALGILDVPLLGQHNLSNALAAVAVGRFLGLDFTTIVNAIQTFQGARRRFEHRGTCNGILFVDDYAHHPSEIQATLAAARLKLNQDVNAKLHRRIVAVFQPHRYSRATALLSEFAMAFNDADHVIVTDIYGAGEPNLSGITGSEVAAAIAQHNPRTTYQATLPELKETLLETLQSGDIALFLTAGNLNQMIPELIAAYQQPTVVGLEAPCQSA